MTHHETRDHGRDRDRDRLASVAADATLGVPGVAFLRPGLTQLLRAAARSAGVRRGHAGTDGAASGVGVALDTGPDRWTIDVYIVASRGHRAVDVTRAVRTAVEEAVLRCPSADGLPARVSVTVSGVV